MKTIGKLEQLRERNANLKEWDVNPTFYRAYRSAIETGNDLLDLNDVVWEDDVKPIIEHCKEFDINQITMSSNFSSAIQVLGLFEDNGCKVIGLTKVKSQYTDFNNKDYKIINAIIIQIL